MILAHSMVSLQIFSIESTEKHLSVPTNFNVERFIHQEKMFRTEISTLYEKHSSTGQILGKFNFLYENHKSVAEMSEILC